MKSMDLKPKEVKQLQLKELDIHDFKLLSVTKIKNESQSGSVEFSLKNDFENRRNKYNMEKYKNKSNYKRGDSR